MDAEGRIHVDPAPQRAAPSLPNGPELWDKLLEAVKEVYEPEFCCIAGGAVRDYALGKDPKDIDIFVKMGKEDYSRGQCIEEAEYLGWKNIQPVGKQYGQNNNQIVFRANVFG